MSLYKLGAKCLINANKIYKSACYVRYAVRMPMKDDNISS